MCLVILETRRNLGSHRTIVAYRTVSGNKTEDEMLVISVVLSIHQTTSHCVRKLVK